MISFIDGPAAGQELSLRRTPLVLRVVQGRDGTWDALDQPDDQPKKTEQIWPYILVSVPTWIHLCARGNKALHGWWPTAEYQILRTPTASDRELRLPELWSCWCAANRMQILRQIPSDVRAAHEKRAQ